MRIFASFAIAIVTLIVAGAATTAPPIPDTILAVMLGLAWLSGFFFQRGARQ